MAINALEVPRLCAIQIHITLHYLNKLYSQCCVERPLLFASAFDNRLADRKSAFKRFNGNNQARSHPNLVNFRPTILEFSLLKRAISAAI